MSIYDEFDRIERGKRTATLTTLAFAVLLLGFAVSVGRGLEHAKPCVTGYAPPDRATRVIWVRELDRRGYHGAFEIVEEEPVTEASHDDR